MVAPPLRGGKDLAYMLYDVELVGKVLRNASRPGLFIATTGSES